MNLKQKRILKKLCDINGQKFSELAKGFTVEEKFPYHLRFLLDKNYIVKKQGRYYMTKEGMQATSFFDSRNLADFKLAQPIIIFVCEHNGQFLINKHFEKDPNKSRHLITLPSAKPVWGLSLEESCKREFLRKFERIGSFTYRSTFHSVNLLTDGTVLFDSLFLIYDVTITDDQFTREKENDWMTLEEIEKNDNISIVLKRFVVENYNNSFIEENVVLDYGI